MRFAYADPPYLGLAEKFYGHLHEAAADYDKPETHRSLIEKLAADFDGWALSLHTPSLREILPMCPPDVRVCPWVKPFCSFKPGVGVAYAWEPVIFWGGRRRTREQHTVRDWCAANITLERGFTGAKPLDVVWWILDVLNAEPEDEFVDMFPGSGAVTAAYQEWLKRPRHLFDAPAVQGEIAFPCDSRHSPNGRDAKRLGAEPEWRGDARSAAIAQPEFPHSHNGDIRT